MKDELTFPETLQEAVKYFADDDRAFNYIATNGKSQNPFNV